MAGVESSTGMEQVAVRGFSLLRPGANHREDVRSTWILAVAGLLVAMAAAGALDLSPRWFANNPAMVLLHSARIVLTTAAMGCAAVGALWYLVSDKPSAGPVWVACNLSSAWVFLPCFQLFDQARSPLALLFAALVAGGFALSLRRLIPVRLEPAAAPVSNSPLPSLDGLPPADSPVVLAACIAVLLQGATALAIGASVFKASLPLGVAVFLLTWRWSAYETRAADWWGGRYPPLRQFVAAVLMTATVLVPYSIGGRFGWSPHPYRAAVPVTTPRDAHASTGYFGIILYPPPRKTEILAPMPHSDTFLAGALAKPLVIRFDGPYLYFKQPGVPPGPKAHVAHGKPTDAGINVRSTDLDPIVMEAHQRVSRPIDLAACGEIDVAVSNADTHDGEIDLALMLADTSLPGHPRQVLAARPVLSSMMDPIPKDRAPVNEVLRFNVPAGAHLRRFDEISVRFLLAPSHARAGAKISVENFELVPRR